MERGGDPEPWEKLEERRSYRGMTHLEVAEACRTAMAAALGEGYLADSVLWSPDDLEVTVDYVYDPSRARGSI